MKTTLIILFATSSLLLVSCFAPLGPELQQRAESHPTSVTISYLDEENPNGEWRKRVEANAEKAETILGSQEFAEAFRREKIRGTRGKTVNEVLFDLQYSGEKEVEVGFYNNPNTRAIAYEQNGQIFFNTAKSEAGGPGNIAHELTHKMGYKHFTNWAFLGKRSVPYTVGRVVDSVSE